LTVKFIRTPGLGDSPYPDVMEPNLDAEYNAKN
ncbi:MAG: 30S ribosomal protein S4, partial [Cypionkella sp.]|nr:30S ribosomal protein S4 [Cypionkella sp.]